MSRPLRVGLQLPEVERVVRWQELRGLAVLAEDVGFDSLWVGDHLLYRDEAGVATGPWEAWTSLAAIAAATSRVRIGPLVAATAFHGPAMLAKLSATVQEISGGRLVLGLGAGWNRVEFDGFGIPYDRRVARFEEAFGIVVALLAGEEVHVAGEFHHLDGTAIRPLPAAGPPPIMIGSIGPRMLRIAMPHADAWNAWHAWFGNRPEGLAPLMSEVDRACYDVGRDPGEVERTAAVLVATPEGVGRRMGGEGSRPGTERSAPISGTPSQVADTLRGFAGAGLSAVQAVDFSNVTEEEIERVGAAIGSLLLNPHVGIATLQSDRPLHLHGNTA